MTVTVTIQEAASVLGQKFLMEHGVTGVSHLNETEELIVYVESDAAAVRVPETLMGYPVRTKVTGKINALSMPYLPPAKIGRTAAGFAGSKSARWRPAPGGVSIGHYTITAGTLGTRVYDASTGQRLILSNNHVLAAVNKGKPGDPILQPGKYDGGADPADRIALLERFVTIKPSPASNLVDCAVARPINDGDLSDEILDAASFTKVGDAAVGMTVFKSGRTSCYGEAKVIDVNATVKVNMGEWGEALFEDQILTEPLGKPGDSGSGIGDAAAKDTAVGLLYAGSDSVTALNKFPNVCREINVTVAPGAIVPPRLDTAWSIGALALGCMPLAVVGSVIASKESSEWWEAVRPK